MSDYTVEILVRESGADQAGQNIKNMGDKAEHATGQTEGLNEATAKLTEVMTALGLALGVEKLIELSDQYTDIINKLAIAVPATESLGHVMEQLVATSMATHMSLDSTASLYKALSTGTQNLAYDSKELMGVLGTMEKAMQLSGASSDVSSTALRRFSASMVAGTIDSRGLTTLLMQFPVIAQAVAGGLNMSVTQLKAAAAQGQISVEQFMHAMESSARAVDTNFSHMALTAQKALTDLGTALLAWVGRLDEMTGAGAGLANAIEFLAHNMSTVAPLVFTLVAAMGTYTTAVLVARVATSSFFTAWNPVALVLTAIAAIVAALLTYGNQVKLSADGSITALGAVTGAVKFLGEGFRIMGHYVLEVTTALGSNRAALIGVGVAIGTVALTYAALQAVKIAAWFMEVAAAARALALSVLAATGPIGAITIVLVGAAVGAAYFSGALDGLIEKAKNIASSIGEGLTKSMKEASAEIGHGSEEAKGFGNALDTMAGTATKAAKHIVDEGTTPVQQGFKLMGESATKASMEIRDAMGNVVGTLDSVSTAARMAGSTFDSMKDKAVSDAQQISSAFQSAASSISGASHAAVSFQGGGGVNQVLTNQGWMSVDDIVSKTGADSSAVQDYLRNNTMSGHESIWDIFQGSQQFTKKFATGGEFQVGGAGGVDSQLVQFMATPGEEVVVKRPGRSGGGGGGPIHVTMNIATPDANSFQRSQNQILVQLQSKLAGVQGRLS